MQSSTSEGTSSMNRTLAAVAAVAGPLALTAAAAAPAAAAPTGSAELVCAGLEPVLVTGFGRGQVLQVVGSNAVFVVTSAALADGSVVFDNPGLADADDVVTCTTTSPVSKASFTFRGFFTPRR